MMHNNHTAPSVGVKRSAYVKEFPLGDSMLLANVLWRTYLKLDAEDAKEWTAFSAKAASLESIRTELRQRLLNENMLVNEELDEHLVIARRYQDTRHSPHVLGLTIAPTIDCNFACVYCYEDKRPGRMSQEVERQIIDYVKRMVPGRRLFQVTWYGGEPLMCKETIYRLSEAFATICQDVNCKYVSHLVTNGYLLTPEVAKHLSDIAHLEYVQFTIDGYGVAHDAKRPTKAGRPTFERVLRNLIEACAILPTSLRMNVDLLNPDGCHELLDELAKRNVADKLGVYFAPIHPFGKGCRDISEQSTVEVVSNSAFASLEPALLEHARRLGFRTKAPYDGPWLVQCQAVSSNAYVVEPDGSLQRCWIEVGEDDKRVGHISRPVEFAGVNNMRWMRFDPTRDKPCRDCEVLPLCFGGCPHRHVYGAPEEFTCNQIRYNLSERLLDDYLRKYEADAKPGAETACARSGGTANPHTCSCR